MKNKLRKWVLCYNITFNKYKPEWMVNYGLKKCFKSDSFEEVQAACDKKNAENNLA